MSGVQQDPDVETVRAWCKEAAFTFPGYTDNLLPALDHLEARIVRIAEQRQIEAERNVRLEARLSAQEDQTVNAGRLREAVRQRLARINEGEYSVIEMAADLEKLLAVQWSGECYRSGCQAGRLSALTEAAEVTLAALDDGDTVEARHRLRLALQGESE